MALTMEEIYDEILKEGGKTPSIKVKETASRYPERVAMRYKEFGLWQETTYADFWLKSNFLSMGLKFFGVRVAYQLLLILCQLALGLLQTKFLILSETINTLLQMVDLKDIVPHLPSQLTEFQYLQ